MISLVMIVRHILLECMPERGFSKEDEPRETLLLDRPHPALRVGIHIRRPRWQRHAFDAGLINDALKSRAELPIPVMDQVLPGRQEAPLLHGHIASHLHRPCCIGMRRHPGDMHFPCTKSDKEQDVICYEPTQRPDLGREEVRRDEHVQMRADELLPRRGGLTLWRRWEAMALEDIADRLVANSVPEI